MVNLQFKTLIRNHILIGTQQLKVKDKRNLIIRSQQITKAEFRALNGLRYHLKEKYNAI